MFLPATAAAAVEEIIKSHSLESSQYSNSNTQKTHTHIEFINNSALLIIWHVCFPASSVVLSLFGGGEDYYRLGSFVQKLYFCTFVQFGLTVLRTAVSGSPTDDDDRQELYGHDQTGQTGKNCKVDSAGHP